VKTAWKQKSMQATSCLLCILVWWRNESWVAPLTGTEFSGGWLTGPLLNGYIIGGLLFAPALLLAFFFRRIAAVIAIVASLLCLPLYLYFTAPGPFRRVFRSAEFEAPLRASFIGNKWAIIGILVLVIAMYMHLRGFIVAKNAKT
jgi:hypothetical protein